MIPTFLIDTPVMVLLGMLYTPLAREAAGPFYRAKTFQASCRLAGGFLVLVAVSYVFYPDWMWMYFVNTEEIAIASQTAIIAYVLLALYFFPFIAGYFLGTTLYPMQRSMWWAGVILNLAIEASLIIALWDRYTAVGTWQNFMQGTSRSLSDFHLLGVLLNGGGILLVIGGIWQWRNLRAGQKGFTQRRTPPSPRSMRM